MFLILSREPHLFLLFMFPNNYYHEYIMPIRRLSQSFEIIYPIQIDNDDDFRFLVADAAALSVSKSFEYNRVLFRILFLILLEPFSYNTAFMTLYVIFLLMPKRMAPIYWYALLYSSYAFDGSDHWGIVGFHLFSSSMTCFDNIIIDRE